MTPRDIASLREIVRLCDLGERLAARGHDWYVGDHDNVPGLAAESIIIKLGENVARVSGKTLDRHPEVPWSDITRMRDPLVHRYTSTDYDVVWSTLVNDLPVIGSYICPLTT